MCPPPWSWPSFRTIPQGDRRLPGPGCGGHEQNYTAKIRKPPTPQPELFSLEEEPGGGLPAPLSEVAGWQERVQRHCVEHLAEVCPIVQILDADVPLPLLVTQYAAIWNMEEDFQVPELVIEVPKISLDVIPLRTLVPEPQKAVQLVEMPTIFSFSSLQRSVEQLVDIPVPGVGGPSSGLQGFSSGQSSTASPSKKRISERIVEQIVDPVSRGGLPGSSFSHSPTGVDERANERGFSHFSPNEKNSEGCFALGVGTAPRVEPIHAGCSAGGLRRVGAAQGTPCRQDFFWNRRTNSTVWRAPAGVEVVWYGERNEEGAVYYWHRDTRASTFDLPPLPPE